MNIEGDQFLVLATLLGRRSSDVLDDESSSSSDDDEILEYLRVKRLVLRPRIPQYEEVISLYSDVEFKSHFRMERSTFNFLLNKLTPFLVSQNVAGMPTIPPRKQLYVAIWKMATCDSYRSVTDRFNIGKATALRAVRRVAEGLFRLAPTFIKWPDAENANRIAREFEVASGFPGVIGAIGGTHIEIEKPAKDGQDYINRKGYPSIQLQIVCDYRMNILHAYTGHPGSVHDQRVFRNSEIAEYLLDNSKFPEGTHLLGDAAYELSEHLMTPFRDNGHLTIDQKLYNYRHSSARVAVERGIGLLKNRMRSLLNCLPLHNVTHMPTFIIGCCVLHNICLMRGDELDIDMADNDQINSDTIQPSDDIHVPAPAMEKRDRIMRSLTH